NYNLVSEHEGSTTVSIEGEKDFKDVYVYGGKWDKPEVELTRPDGRKVRFANKRISKEASPLFFYG
ncbi:MAG TPA: hypothetical protein VJH95_05580, partial [Candidatus Nanoarchaeia archaeon]|nr:hypothetical protein [Candidatus Nanoarchaeia archaeon]